MAKPFRTRTDLLSESSGVLLKVGRALVFNTIHATQDLDFLHVFAGLDLLGYNLRCEAWRNYNPAATYTCEASARHIMLN